jgi:uncharacterized membrane protein YgcG
MLRSDDSAFWTGLPFPRLAYCTLCLVVAALALGCTPKIGDSCTVSTNCSAAGDRLCDITQPGGYCTIFNCEPGTCPTDSVCINFGTALSAAAGCTPSQGNSPYQRSFCMASCASDGDCRAGYACLNLTGHFNPMTGQPTTTLNQLGAVLAESSGSGKVCAVKLLDYSAELSVPPKNSNEVCIGDTSATAAGGSSAGANSGGAPSGGGAGGSSGASGDGGAAG